MALDAIVCFSTVWILKPAKLENLQSLSDQINYSKINEIELVREGKTRFLRVEVLDVQGEQVGGQCEEISFFGVCCCSGW